MKNFWLYFSFLFVLSCSSNKEGLYNLQTPTGSVLRLEIAKTFKERAKGLMFRESLDKDVGMLFIFEEPLDASFWMKNTSIPLSIAFIDIHGKIVNIEHMEPFSLEAVKSILPVKYAIEVNRGVFPHFGIYPGIVLRMP